MSNERMLKENKKENKSMPQFEKVLTYTYENARDSHVRYVSDKLNQKLGHGIEILVEPGIHLKDKLTISVKKQPTLKGIINNTPENDPSITGVKLSVVSGERGSRFIAETMPRQLYGEDEVNRYMRNLDTISDMIGIGNAILNSSREWG